MTENEKRLAGRMYDPMDEEIQEIQRRGMKAMYEFNSYGPDDNEQRISMLPRLLGGVGDNCFIEPPIHANWGAKNLFIGNNVYINFNLSLVDDVAITLGDNVQLGPNVTLITANHPLDPAERAKGLQKAEQIVIEDGAWLGAGVIVLPGVTIGKNAVVGAGSVVTKDIPEGTVAVGNPAKVIKQV